MRRVGECRNTWLSMLYGKLSELKSCEKLVKKYLPEKLAQHCHISQTQYNSITITVDNAGMLSLLRYEKSELLRKLRVEENMHALRAIDLKLISPHLRTHSQTTTLINKAASCPAINQESIRSASLEEALELLHKTLSLRRMIL